MTTFVNQDSTTSNTNIGLSPDESLFVTRGTTIISTAGDAVAAGDNSDITNYGELIADRSGLDANGPGNAFLTNFGTIHGERGGVNIAGSLTNFGDISSGADFEPAVEFFTGVGVSEIATFTNFGDIAGSEAINGDVDEADITKNYGDITGRVYLDGGNDSFFNHGNISGNIDTGEGFDEFENNKGIVDGMIDLGADNDSLLAGPTAEDADGGSGIDTVDYRMSQNAVDVRLWAGLGEGGDASGDKIVNFENVVGGAGDDLLAGSGAMNALTGLGGDDRLYGGGRDDTLQGGAGADRLVGGDGADTAAYRWSAEGVTVRLFDGFAGGGDAAGDALVGTENLSGSNFDDLLAGEGGRNVLSGEGGDDDLFGAAGNDLLTGGAGADKLFGGSGRDTVSYAESSSSVDVQLFNDRAEGGDATGDELFDIENLVGSAQGDLLAGNGQANSLSGNAGDDQLFGGGGNDFLNPGAGTDTMFGSSGDDTFVFTPGTGTNTIGDFDATTAGVDQLNVTAFGISDDFATFKSNDVSQDGVDTLIDLGGGDTIRLTGVQTSEFTSDDVVL